MKVMFSSTIKVFSWNCNNITVSSWKMYILSSIMYKCFVKKIQLHNLNPSIKITFRFQSRDFILKILFN